MHFVKRKKQRFKPYNYSQPGYYFITICTHNHKNLFGKIINGKMKFNEIGKIVDKNITLLNNLYENFKIDYFTIMPNHIHMILINYINVTSDNDRTKMTVSKLIQLFKSSITKEIRKIKKYKMIVWQKSFYDRIIRNEKELYFIRKYIQENPLRWNIEKSIPENLNL